MPTLLRKSDREWVVERIKRYETESSRNGVFRQKDQRIRNKGRAALGDLTYLAENLAKDQFEQIFTLEELRKLVAAILNRRDLDFNRQLSLGAMMIQEGTSLTKRREMMQKPNHMGQIKLTLSLAEKVLVENVKRRT